MLSMFKRKKREAQAAVAVMTNRDLMQAVVFGAFYVAAADGDLSAAEMAKLEKLISNTPELKGFGPELGNTMDLAEKAFTEGGARILRQRAEKELADLAHSPTDAVTVINIMLTIADEDGIGAEEMVILEKSAKIMGLNLKDYL
jgi:tellurite resistance protein TerB